MRDIAGRTGRAGYIKVGALGGKGESGMSERANHDYPLSTDVGHCNGVNMRVLREKMTKSSVFRGCGGYR